MSVRHALETSTDANSSLIGIAIIIASVDVPGTKTKSGSTVSLLIASQTDNEFAYLWSSTSLLGVFGNRSCLTVYRRARGRGAALLVYRLQGTVAHLQQQWTRMCGVG